MNRVVFLMYGDSNNPSTWSNVPYLLTNTFEEKGYIVERVDISTKKNIFYYLYSLLCKIIKPSTTYYYYRSKSNRKKVEKKIKQAVKLYDRKTDFYFVFGYDFSPSDYTNKKVILFSDWPIEYAIERRFCRKPDFMEKKDILRHKSVIESADICISLFQDVAIYMNEKFKNKTFYLGNLINSFYPIEGFENIKERTIIVFIGKKSYIDSAYQIIHAINMYNEKNKQSYTLHIIGMNASDFDHVNLEQVVCHGYLDKGNDEQKSKYYHILKKALVIINTSEKWAGMSSIIESMYYYRPIITSKYDEFVKTFGKRINFGYYCCNKKEEIYKCLHKLIHLSNHDYQKMCENAHNAVKDFTYSSYVDKIIQLLEKK